MHHLSTSDDTKLYFKDWQAAAVDTEASTPKRTVVLLSGWPLSADSWEDQAHALAAAGHRVIAYDRRGFGRSSQPFTGYDYDTLADDLHAVLERTQAHNVVLVGFSMGGGEVVRYLAKYPENNVIKAALIASVVPFKVVVGADASGTANAAYEQTKQAILKDRPAFFSGFFEKFFGVSEGVEAVSPELLLWARSIALQGCLPATLGCLKAFSHTNFDADLPAIKVPLLVLHGSSDKIVPVTDAGRKKLEALPLAQLIVYPDAPHGLFATHKARLTHDLLGFVES
jgi:non-heme chloroperoxidase